MGHWTRAMGAENHRTARTTSTCQETKKGESNIQARVLIYTPHPKQSTEKRALHIIHTLYRQPHPSKQPAPPSAPLNRDEPPQGKQPANARPADTPLRRPTRRNERRATSHTAPHDGTTDHAPPHAQASDKQSGERGTHDHRGTEKARGKQQRQIPHTDPRGIRSTKKKTGRGFHHLIPVSRPSYLIGIGLSEAPTMCSTRATAAFLVLKP